MRRRAATRAQPSRLRAPGSTIWMRGSRAVEGRGGGMGDSRGRAMLSAAGEPGLAGAGELRPGRGRLGDVIATGLLVPVARPWEAAGTRLRGGASLGGKTERGGTPTAPPLAAPGQEVRSGPCGEACVHRGPQPGGAVDQGQQARGVALTVEPSLDRGWGSCGTGGGAGARSLGDSEAAPCSEPWGAFCPRCVWGDGNCVRPQRREAGEDRVAFAACSGGRRTLAVCELRQGCPARRIPGLRA